ncbi:hypothetical protein HII31_01948 [Pseudocercospora fuligena]|uniref:Uncharacterized protein n=1 Tax=Pseudocercospora fuligena TaxID=685502 RepID=A0A8H6RSM2_9PEZI|nr:hypothetical protein HII31_01948 [Pseudocercospora fuligena]
MAASSGGSRVASIPELLEQILLYLAGEDLPGDFTLEAADTKAANVRTLLFSQCTSQAFRDTIAGSRELQKALYLRPDFRNRPLSMIGWHCWNVLLPRAYTFSSNTPLPGGMGVKLNCNLEVGIKPREFSFIPSGSMRVTINFVRFDDSLYVEEFQQQIRTSSLSRMYAWNSQHHVKELWTNGVKVDIPVEGSMNPSIGRLLVAAYERRLKQQLWDGSVPDM